MTRVLLTGFDAFANTPNNPAGGVARALDGTKVSGAEIVSRILPVAFFRVLEAAHAAIAEVRPDVIVMLGEYGGRSMLTVERFAHNINDSTRYGLEDNDGRSIQDEPTAPDGPVAYQATLPIRAMVKAMRESGVPADISDTPGTFCCNHLMYGVLHHVATERPGVRAGWIHVPYLPSTAALEANLGAPSMSLETSVTGVAAGIRAISENAVDIRDPIRSCFQI